MAAPGADQGDGAVELVQSVAPDAGADTVALTQAAGLEQLVAAAADVDVTAADGYVELASGSDTADALRFSLPAEFSQDTPALDQGLAVFSSTVEEDDAVIVEPLADGSVQVQTLTTTPADVHEYDYEFDGVTLRLQDDGSVQIVADGPVQGPARVLGTIAAPWALDASGAPVQTHYRVEGATLTQVIEPSATTSYPIVADPRVTFGVGVYIYMTGHEMRVTMAALNAVAIGAGVATCKLYIQKLGKWPFAKPVVTALCGWVGLGALKSLAQSVLRDVGSTYSKPCYELRWWLNKWYVKSVSSSLC